VPLPHQAGSRSFSVELTSAAMAARRLSRLTNRCLVARSTASLSPCVPPVGDAFDPDVGAQRVTAPAAAACGITSRGVASRVATVVNAFVKSVTKSDSFRKSSRSMTPHRVATSACSLARLSGIFSLSRYGTCQRGSVPRSRSGFRRTSIPGSGAVVVMTLQRVGCAARFVEGAPDGDCCPVRTRPGGGRDEGLVVLVAQGAGMGSWSSRSCSGAMLKAFWMPSLRVPRPSVVFLPQGASMRLLVSSIIDLGSRLR
jgi:hypothetical protein